MFGSQSWIIRSGLWYIMILLLFFLLLRSAWSTTAQSRTAGCFKNSTQNFCGASVRACASAQLKRCAPLLHRVGRGTSRQVQEEQWKHFRFQLLARHVATKCTCKMSRFWFTINLFGVFLLLLLFFLENGQKNKATCVCVWVKWLSALLWHLEIAAVPNKKSVTFS